MRRRPRHEGRDGFAGANRGDTVVVRVVVDAPDPGLIGGLAWASGVWVVMTSINNRTKSRYRLITADYTTEAPRDGSGGLRGPVRAVYRRTAAR